MQDLQNIIILLLILWIITLYGKQKNIKYWKDYYKKESETFLHDSEELYFELQEKLNKAEEIISQQKEELLTRKQSKKK